MDLYNAMQNYIGLFLLIFVRISGMVVLAPVIGSRNIPPNVKAGFSLTMTLIALPLLAGTNVVIPDQLLSYLFLVGSELICGMTIGFVSSLIFAAVQMTGSLLDTQIGFGMVNVFDPQAGQQVPLVGNFQYILGLLLFLSLDGHHVLLTALFDSFKIVPLSTVTFHASLTEYIVTLVCGIFVVAFKITLPVLIALIIAEVALGILARTMPQMNIFVVGVPAKIIVGIFVLSAVVPYFIRFLEVGFHAMYQDVYRLLEIFRP